MVTDVQTEQGSSKTGAERDFCNTQFLRVFNAPGYLKKKL